MAFSKGGEVVAEHDQGLRQARLCELEGFRIDHRVNRDIHVIQPTTKLAEFATQRSPGGRRSRPFTDTAKLTGTRAGLKQTLSSQAW